MSIFETKPFLYNLDILSGTPRVFVSSHKSYSTIFGLFITFLLVLIGIIYTLYELYIFYFEREISIVELSDNFMTKNISIPINELLFAFNVFNVSMRMDFFWGKEINLLSAKDVSKNILNNSYVVYLYYMNPETKQIITRYHLETELCEIGKNINQDLVDKYNFSDYKKFLCISKNNNYNFVINKTHSSYIDVAISIKMDTINGLYNHEVYYDDNEYLSNYSYLEFQMYSQDDIISNKNYSSPIKSRKNYYNYELISPGVYELFEMNSKYVDYSSDNNYIFKGSKQYNGISIDSFSSKNLPISSSVEMAKYLLYYEVKYYLDADKIESYERVYKKLPSVLADISTVFSLLVTIGKLTVEFLCRNYLETEAMSRIIKYKKEEISNNINDKHGIKTIKFKENIGDRSSLREMNKNNEFSSIINDQSKKIFIRKSENMFQPDKIEPEINNNKKDNKISNKKKLSNKTNSSSNKFKNNNIISKNKINYEKTFVKIIGVNPQKENSISLFDYLGFLIKQNKNNRTKMIGKISDFFENSLSIERIIIRAINFERIKHLIKMRLNEDYNEVNFFKILIKRDKELKAIIENESKKC